MSVGPVVIGIGLVLFARIGPSANYLSEVFPAVLVLGFGLAINVAPLTATVLAAAPAENAGMASAVNNDVSRAAALIAVAVLPAAAGLTGSAYLHPDVFSAGFRTACSSRRAVHGRRRSPRSPSGTRRGPRPRRRPRPGAGGPRGSRCALDAPPVAVSSTVDPVRGGEPGSSTALITPSARLSKLSKKAGASLSGPWWVTIRPGRARPATTRSRSRIVYRRSWVRPEADRDPFGEECRPRDIQLAVGGSGGPVEIAFREDPGDGEVAGRVDQSGEVGDDLGRILGGGMP